MKLTYDEKTTKLYDEDGNDIHDLKVIGQKCKLRCEIILPKEYADCKARLRIFLSNPKKRDYVKKYPKGCSFCSKRRDCRYIKINDVMKCSTNRENLIKLGYRRR